MKKTKTLVCFALVLVMLFSAILPAAAAGTGKSYVYTYDKQATEIPDPYEVVTLAGQGLGMIAPEDMVIYQEQLYILDSGHSAEKEGYMARVVVLDKSYNFVREIQFKAADGTTYAFTEPRGLWVDQSGTMYIADRSNKNIALFTNDGALIKELGKPDSPLLNATDTVATTTTTAAAGDTEATTTTTTTAAGATTTTAASGDEPTVAAGTDYLPTKVMTDSLGIIYVRVENEYRGMITMDQDGNFLGFFGSNEVVMSAENLAVQFWRIFMSDEAKAKTAKLLPMEYSNFCMSPDGTFVYGVRGATSDMQELIRKINCKGKNVLQYKKTFGDYSLSKVSGTPKTTNFNAITVDSKGFITVFDSTWQRLFQYTPEGDLMYVFGGQGSQQGTFSNGVDLECWGDNLLVLDKTFATVTVMKPTTFGTNVRLGEEYYSKGDYQSSMQPFQAVITQCMNYEFGYQGIGKALYMARDYQGAMAAFKLAHDQTDYSSAFKMYRGEITQNALVPVLLVILGLIVLWAVLKFLKYKGILRSKKLVLDESGKVKYLFHTMLHPIEGYEEMRYNKKYSMTIANIAIFFFFFSSVIMSLYSGFIFNGTTADKYNVFITLASVIGGLSLFVLVNWLMSTFFEGKGKLKEVWIYLAYATIPYSITCFLYTLLSNVLTQEEATFLTYLMIVGQGWALIMAFFALKGLHMYTGKRNIVAILVTILGMLVVLFIMFLMFNLFMQFFSFVEMLYKEIMYRSVVGF